MKICALEQLITKTYFNLGCLNLGMFAYTSVIPRDLCMISQFFTTRLGLDRCICKGSASSYVHSHGMGGLELVS